ncbi:MAG: NAD(P)H-dependent oxidoreductase [Hyphomicrobiales bacterium]
MSKLLVVQGHPDAENAHYCHAIAEAYISGAVAGGHDIRQINIGELNVPFLRSQAESDSPDPAQFVTNGQNEIEWAEHIVFVYPLWLGTMPALLKAWLEQVLRSNFAFKVEGKGWKSHLWGRSAHIVITMGMPSIAFRWFFLAHSLKSFERNILKFCGIKPVRHTLIGSISTMDDRARKKWLLRLEKLGRQAR